MLPLGFPRGPHLKRGNPPRYQRCVLLPAMKIRIAELTLEGRPRNAELESERVVAFEEAHDAHRALVELGEELGRQHAGTLHAAVALLVAEQDVESEDERSGVLAADEAGELCELRHGRPPFSRCRGSACGTSPPQSAAWPHG